MIWSKYQGDYFISQQGVAKSLESIGLHKAFNKGGNPLNANSKYNNEENKRWKTSIKTIQ